MTRSFHIETFGCQMNKNDSELMYFSMESAGFVYASTEDDADIVIFNTCSVRQHAEDRAASRIHAAKKSRQFPDGLVVLAGCMGQRIGNEMAESGEVDLVVGPYQSPRIGEIVAGYLAGNAREFTSQHPEDFSSRLNPELVKKKGGLSWHEWVTITHGCSNFCSYCIVPQVRGPLISFPSGKILEYIRGLVGEGVMEISLLGQNVNQYGMDSGDMPFHQLLKSCAAIDGIKRINFLTSHPRDFSADTLRVMADHAIISRSLHIPLQSGSDAVLARMNRQYSLRRYMDIVESIRALLPDAALSTDLIVGFPGETEDDYQATLQAVERIGFDEAFMYAYSPRAGTAACAMEEGISPQEKQARLSRLIALQREQGQKKLTARIGCLEQVIVERTSKKSPHEVMGATERNHPAVLPGSAADIGTLIAVRVTGLKGSTLYGERVG